VGILDGIKMKKQTKETFYNKVEKTSKCWNWTGARDKDGYGQVSYLGTQHKAHRISLVLEDRLRLGCKEIVMHLCDNTSCVNPSHLKLGTSEENNRDTVLKGRYKNSHMLKTNCIKGHPFVGNNLYIDPSGKRCCRTCRRISDRKRYQKQKGA
jgi:hypothetical protein